MQNLAIFIKGNREADYHRQQVGERGILELIDTINGSLQKVLTPDEITEFYGMLNRIETSLNANANDPRTKRALNTFEVPQKKKLPDPKPEPVKLNPEPEPEPEAVNEEPKTTQSEPESVPETSEEPITETTEKQEEKLEETNDETPVPETTQSEPESVPETSEEPITETTEKQEEKLEETNEEPAPKKRAKKKDE